MLMNIFNGRLKLSPSERAARTRQSKVTYAIYELLRALPDDAKEEDVVKIFADFKAHRDAKYAAFVELDERPGGFSGQYWTWHSKLRRCRNHPVHGRELFETFNLERSSKKGTT